MRFCRDLVFENVNCSRRAKYKRIVTMMSFFNLSGKGPISHRAFEGSLDKLVCHWMRSALKNVEKCGCGVAVKAR